MFEGKDHKHGYLTVAGKRLETIWIGPPPGDAPTLVFLHEGLGCAAMWRDYPHRLAEATGCGALVYSRLGYGYSDACALPRSTHYMHAEGLNILPELIETAGIQDCILIGHSDGGSIAIIFAGGTAAVSLRGVITEAAHVFCEDISVRSIAMARESFLNGDLRSKLEKYHGANTDCAFWGWNGAWLHPDFMDWNLEAYLPEIRVPLLAIQGEKDEYGTVAQIEAIGRQAGGGAQTILLSGCGHTPHKDRPQATLEAMSRFIRSIIPADSEEKE